MGDLIVLTERLADRSRPVPSGRPAFLFDLACPFSYLVAEQVERALGEIDWLPVSGASLHRGTAGPAVPRMRERAERLAAELGLPMVWPDQLGDPLPAAHRAALYAAEVGSAARFAVAAARLAFCGGFDLRDLDVVAEAAAAAALSPDHAVAAAQESARDRVLEATALGFRRRQVREVPAVRVGTAFFTGTMAATDAASVLRVRSRTAGWTAT